MTVRKRWAGLTLVALGVALAQLAAAQAPPLTQPTTPDGVEVLARGPIHEAFASLTAEAVPSKGVPKQPPAPLEELAPDDKPEGDSVWIGGYWHWDDERKDFLWVSGIWRSLPPGRTWVAGYWRDAAAEGWQWVGGFWAKTAQENRQQEVTYLPAPPPLPNVAAPGQRPNEDSFYVPGQWFWNGDRYVWQVGTWATMAPGYVWVPAHYRWTPGGYVYIPGYWDHAVANRGILYAPVIIRPEVVTVGFVYTPAYAIRETVVVDSLWVRPASCHYYFGDYYGPAYRERGYESCVVYSRRHYDSIIVYESYQRRREPNWINIQIRLHDDRCHGRAPVPPRTLVQQNVNVTQINQKNVTNVTNVYNTTVIAPAAQVAADKGVKVAKLDTTTRQAASQQAVAVRRVSEQRTQTEAKGAAAGPLKKASVQSLDVPKPAPVQAGFKPAVTTPARPVEPQPTKPTKPTMPTNPMTPIVKPVTPTQPAKPTPPTPQPAKPPTNPVTPTKPVEKPVTPISKPVEKPPLVQPQPSKPPVAQPQPQPTRPPVAQPQPRPQPMRQPPPPAADKDRKDRKDR